MDHYADLARLALAQCPPGFDEARVGAEVDDGYSEIDLRCRRGAEEVHVTNFPAEDSFAMHLSLEAIREAMASRSGGRKWSRCVFRVFPDGNFKFDVEY